MTERPGNVPPDSPAAGDGPDLRAEHVTDAPGPAAGTQPDMTGWPGETAARDGKAARPPAETASTDAAPADNDPAATAPDDAAPAGIALAATPAADAAPGETAPAAPSGPLEPSVPTEAAPASGTDEVSAAADEIGGEMPLLEHLIELRSRLLKCLAALCVGFFGCYAFAETLLAVLLKPLKEVLPPKSMLIAVTLPEKFFTVMKMSLLAGFFAVSPYIFYQLWKFIAPGLYKEERDVVLPMAAASTFFFSGGAIFGYFIVFPFGFKFFVDYASEYVRILPTISGYFSFAVTLLFAFGLVFELPVVLFFLSRLGLVTAKGLRKHRRWAILGAFVLGAVLTPADPLSQFLMAGPLIVLYELGIVAAALFGKKKDAPDTGSEADGAGGPAAQAAGSAGAGGAAERTG